jgi:hypothetical protein
MMGGNMGGGVMAFDICAQTLTCVRKILDDDSILNGTDIRAKYHWSDNNFIALAGDLEDCFKDAGHPIPHPIDRSAIAGKSTVKQICPVVKEAFGRKDD